VKVTDQGDIHTIDSEALAQRIDAVQQRAAAIGLLYAAANTPRVS